MIPADELPLFSSLWTSDIVSYLDSIMSPSLCAQPQYNIYSRHSIIVITPYCLVAQPSVVLLTTTRSSMVSNSLRSYMRSHTLGIAQSLRHVYKGRHLRVLPSFQSLSDYKVSSLLLNLYSSNDLRSSSQILIQTLPRFQTILLVFAFDKVNRY